MIDKVSGELWHSQPQQKQQATMEGHGLAWFSMVWHGSAWFGMVQYGLALFSMV